jgi:L-arabinonolactonase
MENASPPCFDTLLDRSGRHCRSLRWHAATERLWWTDAASNTVLSWRDGEPGVSRQELVDTPRLLAHCTSGRMLVGMAKRLCLADIQAAGSQRAAFVRTLVTIDAADPRILVGSGRTDRAGNFVLGTCNTAPQGRPIGSFFQFSQQYGLRRLALPTVVSAAAICFNVAGTRMLFADASNGMLYQCAYDASRATVDHVRPFSFPAAAGMTIEDALVAGDDSVWSILRGTNHAGVLVCHEGNGLLRSMTGLEAGSTASLAIAGPKLDRLMLLGRQGSLRELRPAPIHGIAETPFNDTLYSECDLNQQLNPRPPADGLPGYR